MALQLLRSYSSTMFIFQRLVLLLLCTYYCSYCTNNRNPGAAERPRIYILLAKPISWQKLPLVHFRSRAAYYRYSARRLKGQAEHFSSIPQPEQILGGDPFKNLQYSRLFLLHQIFIFFHDI